jgi:short-subunit dehydrogenase
VTGGSARRGDALSSPRGYALLTGASSGLGRSLAHELARRGYHLVLIARRSDVLAELSAQIARSGGNATPLPFDLLPPGAGGRLEAELLRREIDPGGIEVLINNAGAGLFGPFVDAELEALTRVQRLNTGVPLELTHWIAPWMVARGSGTIANVASVAAFSPGPLMTGYYADKAWLLSFGSSLDAELRPQGVRVVTLCPGPFGSDFHEAAGMEPSRLGVLPSADSVARRATRAILRGKVVAPIGVGAHLWAWFGPRLPRRLSRAIMHRLQRRRLPGRSS